MNIEENYINSSRMAKLAIIMFWFFSFFGTSLPFPPEADTIEDIGTSNRTNQIVYSLLLFISLYLLFPKRKQVLILLTREKFLTIFLLWCFISITWSGFKLVSFKRWFQIFTIFLACLTFLLYTCSTSDRLRCFKYVIYPYLVLSLVSVLFIPGAIDHDSGTWRGLAFQKNHFGQISLINIILCYLVFRFSETQKEKSIALMMLIISTGLLFGTNSSTSILSFFVIIFIGTLLVIDSYFRPLGIGHLSSFLVISGIGILLIFVLILVPDLLAIIPNAFGKDMTFSGRADLWEYMLHEIRTHLVLGAGFQGFWIVENIDVLILYESFVWLPLQAHNGYLDMLNEIGLVGMSIFVILLISYFLALSKYPHPHPWKWLVVVTLIINIQETTLFRTGHLTSVMFTFAYLALFMDKLNFEQQEKERQHLPAIAESKS